jgi:hypothetical protein
MKRLYLTSYYEIQCIFKRSLPNVLGLFSTCVRYSDSTEQVAVLLIFELL